AAHLPAVGRVRPGDRDADGTPRIPDGDCEPNAGRARNPSRRRSAVAQAAAESLHLPAARPRPAAVLHVVTTTVRTGATGFPSDVGVAIVAHNNRDKLVATMPSLETAGCPREAILFVDVASTDGTVDWLRATYPGVR